jgi:hypothetical protein
MSIAIVIIELLILFLLSNRLSNALYQLFWVIFKNKYISSGILTFIFLPGTVVHEFAHLLTAEILRVPTGEISFSPKIEDMGDGKQEIGMGSVEIASTDPIRKFIIGFAPTISGLAVLLLLIWLWQHFYPQLLLTWQKVGLTVLIGYFLFAVSNNMFSSSSDMKGAWFIPLIIIIIGIALYIAGIRINLTGHISVLITEFLNILNKALGIVIGVNILVLSLNLLLLRNVFRLK